MTKNNIRAYKLNCPSFLPVCHSLYILEPLCLERLVREEGGHDPAAVDGRRGIHTANNNLELRGHARGFFRILKDIQIFKAEIGCVCVRPPPTREDAAIVPQRIKSIKNRRKCVSKSPGNKDRAGSWHYWYDNLFVKCATPTISHRWPTYGTRLPNKSELCLTTS